MVVSPHRLYNVIGYMSSVGGIALLVWIGLVAPGGNDWPSRPGISRYGFRLLIVLAAVVGAAWSPSDPVSQVSLHDWVWRLLHGVIQRTCFGLAVNAVFWGIEQSLHDSR